MNVLGFNFIFSKKYEKFNEITLFYDIITKNRSIIENFETIID